MGSHLPSRVFNRLRFAPASSIIERLSATFPDVARANTLAKDNISTGRRDIDVRSSVRVRFGASSSLWLGIQSSTWLHRMVVNAHQLSTCRNGQEHPRAGLIRLQAFDQFLVDVRDNMN